MPDFWTHMIGGNMILNELKNENFLQIIHNNRKIFDFGCQGPDFLFYNDFWPWIKSKRAPHIGTSLHSSHTKSIFSTSIDYLVKKKQDDEFPLLFSYFCGFISHYVVDKWCHPFINVRTENSSQHKVFEAKIDVYLVNKYWNKNAYKLSPFEAIDMGKNLPKSIEHFYKEIILTVLKPSLSIDYVNDSYKDMKKVLKIFYSPNPLKRLLLNILNTLLPLDISIYIYPTEVDYEFLTCEELEEFEALFKQGISEGVKLIKLLNSYLSDEVEIQKINESFQNISFGGEVIRKN
ncbi:zinc dependent phospholipase C family protein [Thermohalobacter berrensis]|uniref:Phospholipase C/D domain-containing protein n=1 Tax=Thermohalobacter berrensis TaxID=99594 RepID=A0A419T4U5_9FIRM|nr:zinc dependent phospholipase C family protein [Thermohalobacter berrensis]RKD32459.1 hypothetical protein BET03_11135 [Thermohalobacter berrensis]